MFHSWFLRKYYHKAPVDSEVWLSQDAGVRHRWCVRRSHTAFSIRCVFLSVSGGICIAQSLKIPVGYKQADFDKMIRQLLETRQSRVVVVFASDLDIQYVTPALVPTLCRARYPKLKAPAVRCFWESLSASDSLCDLPHIHCDMSRTHIVTCLILTVTSYFHFVTCLCSLTFVILSLYDMPHIHYDICHAVTLWHTLCSLWHVSLSLCDIVKLHLNSFFFSI